MALDEASAETLKECMATEPNLSYTTVWDELRRDWGIDPQKQSRTDWRAVTLSHSGLLEPKSHWVTGASTQPSSSPRAHVLLTAQMRKNISKFSVN